MTQASWIIPTLIAAVLWGVVGVLQKLGSNRVNASSLLFWVMAGYVLALPLFCYGSGLQALSPKALLLGVLAGVANGLGTWTLFEAFERGAKASIAIPLTALYPLVTLVLAFVCLHERLTVTEWFATLLALCAGVMLSYEPEPKKAVLEP